MTCGGLALWTDRVLCALERLQPDWWEPWLQLMAVLLSAVVSVFIAVGVAKDARKTTLAAVSQQIAAERELITIQLEAEREDRRRDMMRARVVEVATVIDRQMVAPRSEWTREIGEVTAAFTRLSFALPFTIRDELENHFAVAALELMAVRNAMFEDPDAAKMVKWTARYRTMISMIHEEAGIAMIQQILAWQANGSEGR